MVKTSTPAAGDQQEETPGQLQCLRSEVETPSGQLEFSQQLIARYSKLPAPDRRQVVVTLTEETCSATVGCFIYPSAVPKSVSTQWSTEKGGKTSR